MRHRLHLVLVGIPTLWLIGLFVAPLAVMVAISFGTTDMLGNPVFGWYPENYQVVLSSGLVTPFVHSLVYAGITTAICLVIGYPTAYTIARYGGGSRYLLLGLVILPWFVDYLVRIYAWIVIFGDQGVLNSLLHSLGLFQGHQIAFLNTSYAVIGGLVYSYFPFMVMALFASIERVDQSVIDAGKDLYGTPIQTFRHVTLPATLSGVLAGCVLVFLPAAGDFVNAQLLGGPSSTMIGSLINGQFAGGGYWPYGAAIAMVLILLLGAVMALYLRSAARAHRTAIT